MNFAMGPITLPPRAAAAESYPMTPEAGGRRAARGRPTPRTQAPVRARRGSRCSCAADGRPVGGRSPIL